MAKITIDGKDVEISNESMAELRASLLPNGEQLIRDLEPGEYEICGEMINAVRGEGRMRFCITGNREALSWISDRNGGHWWYQRDFERYIGKSARLITADDIVRIEPKTGTALLDELELRSLQIINNVICSVELVGCWFIITPVFEKSWYIVRHKDETEWNYLPVFSEAIKPVADLVESDIVQLYPKEA